MNDAVRDVLAAAFGGPVDIRHSQAAGGGCINETLVLSLSNGERAFLKHHARPPRDFFAREAEGLRLLASAEGGPRIPRVLGLGPEPNPSFLLLEFIEQGRSGPGYPETFARELANLHRTTRERHGLEHDNFIGSTPQTNTPEDDALVFFREHRLRFQQTLARECGRLPDRVDRKIDRLCERLEGLLDLSGERPALVHGDLWSGNHFPDTAGHACLVDPAAHFGLRETDLAMSELFGRLPQAFYDVYAEAFPLNPGYATRRDIYNLYHLLNHVNLFGSSYLGSVESTLDYFVG